MGSSDQLIYLMNMYENIFIKLCLYVAVLWILILLSVYTAFDRNKNVFLLL